MKKNILIISTAILFTLMWLTPAWSVDQAQSGSSMSMPCPKMGQGMGGGMMGGKGMMQGKGMMGGKGMMAGKGRCPHCPMGQGMGMMGGDLMRDFHQWMKQFMAHRTLFDLSPEQMNQLDNVIMEHMKNAIQNKAEIRVAQVELRQMIRETPMDLSTVENQLNQVASLKANFQMEGIRLYSDLLNLLNDQQKAKVEEIIGTPFPAPWEKMFPMSGDTGSEGSGMGMEKPHEEHHMEGPGMETEPQEKEDTEDGSGSAT